MDIPITLVGVEEEDNYEDINNNRMIISTYTFNMDVNIFGPVDTSVGTIIRKVDVDINHMNGTNIQSYHAEVNPITADKDDTYSIDELWTPL